MLACWNHPFEVARIEAQARGDQNQKDLNMVQIFRMIVKEQVYCSDHSCGGLSSVYVWCPASQIALVDLLAHVGCLSWKA